MAATFKKVGNVFNLTEVDADWVWTTNFTQAHEAGGIPIVSIKFVPGALLDKLVLMNMAADSTVETTTMSAESSTETLVEYFDGTLLGLCVDEGNSTLSPGHKIIVVLSATI